MLNFRIQLLIERILSGSRSYLASHPELGVPLGVFNIKDEPTYQDRKKSIGKLGKEGNPLSRKIAEKLGIENPLPSFVTFTPAQEEEIERRIDKAISDVLRDKRDREITGTGPFKEIARTLKTLSEDKVPASDLSVADMEEMLNMIGQMRAGTVSLADNLDKVTDLLALEDTLRLDISKTLGVTNAQQVDMIEDINAAADATSEFGIRANAVLQTFMSITTEIGRNMRIPQDTLERASLLTKTLKGFDAGKFGAAFDSIGMNLQDAMGEVNNTDSAMSEILQTGREFGVVMEAYIGTASDQLKLINTYGFDRGIEGLSRMAAKGQILGLEMGKVTSLADKFFDPEGAIDFAANMQVIGGAVGDLADPFKLMYMATNDLEGLQDAIADTAAAAVHFDEEKGKFSISPDQRRQLKAMAEQMGMSYQELADTAIQSARRAQVFDQFGADIPEESKELIASLATIGDGGVAQVRIPSLDKMVDVENLDAEMIAELSSANMTDEAFYDQQITVSEKTNQYLAGIESAIREQLRLAGGQTAIEGADVQTLSQMVAESMPDNMGPTDDERRQLLDSSVSAADKKAILEAIASRAIDPMEATLKNAFEKIGIPVNDFILRPGEEPIKFNKDDLIIGGTNLLGETQNISNRTTNIENVLGQATTSGGQGGKVLIEGTIKLEGGSETTEVDINRFITRLTQNTGSAQALSQVIVNASNA